MKLQYHLIAFLLLFLCMATEIVAQHWQADAGLIKPFEANVTVSSGKNVQAITDGKPQTYWESNNPLPFHYVAEKRMNFFLNNENFRSIPNQGFVQAAFDGNPNTKSKIETGIFRLQIIHPQALKLITLKADVTDTLEITVQYKEAPPQHLVYLPTQRFQLINFRLQTPHHVSTILLKSHQSFDLYELASLQKYPVEFVQLDFGRVQKIGWIASRHLNSKSVQKIRIYTSLDGNQWQFLLNLNPQAIPYLQIPLKKEIDARFVKIVFTLNLKDYQKANLWEFAVYDRYGPYGKPPKVKVSINDFEHAFGINTIWGWGYSVYSDRLKPGTGPGKFRMLTSQLRTYHRLDWDMKNPQHLPDYQQMADGKGTPVNQWLNWDREYGYWKTFDYHIDATLSFKEDNFPDTLWKNPFEESFVFGQKFGQHFGKNDHPLLDKIEIGNEPWNYSGVVYQKILAGMSKGIHSVSNVKILPCAVQAYKPASDNHDYISKYLSQDNTRWIAGLNTHIYSYVFRKDGKRVAVMPEDPRSAVWSMANLSRYRDTNLPGKKIYVTEFGFDAAGGGENCIHAECVSEEQQAVFGVRMALILWRLGAENFYWYYFANVQYDSFLHNRSGLCGSYATGFKKKLAFYTFRKTYQFLGPYHFFKVAREDDQVYAYWFKNFNNGKRLLVVWRPVTKIAVTPRWITLPVSDSVNKITPLLEGFSTPYEISSGKLKLKLAGSPVFVEF